MRVLVPKLRGPSDPPMLSRSCFHSSDHCVVLDEMRIFAVPDKVPLARDEPPRIGGIASIIACRIDAGDSGYPVVAEDHGGISVFGGQGANLGVVKDGEATLISDRDNFSAVAKLRGGSVCLNSLAGLLSGSPAGDHAAARSGCWKYTSSGVRQPRLECGRMLL